MDIDWRQALAFFINAISVCIGSYLGCWFYDRLHPERLRTLRAAKKMQDKLSKEMAELGLSDFCANRTKTVDFYMNGVKQNRDDE